MHEVLLAARDLAARIPMSWFLKRSARLRRWYCLLVSGILSSRLNPEKTAHETGT